MVRFKIFLYCILLAPSLFVVIAYQFIYCLTIVTVLASSKLRAIDDPDVDGLIFSTPFIIVIERHASFARL